LFFTLFCQHDDNTKKSLVLFFFSIHPPHKTKTRTRVRYITHANAQTHALARALAFREFFFFFLKREREKLFLWRLQKIKEKRGFLFCDCSLFAAPPTEEPKVISFDAE